jgi:hypothetical protein
MWLLSTLDTGGEVKASILGCLLHHFLEGRGAGLLGSLSPKPGL